MPPLNTEEELKKEFMGEFSWPEDMLDPDNKKREILSDANEVADWWLSKIHSREERMKKAIEGMKNPYAVVDMTQSDLAEWALIEGGKRLGFERMREDLMKGFPNTDVR